MGRKLSISPEQGAQLLEAYRRLGNKSAAAREIGVSEDAASRYLAETPKAAAPAVATQQAVIEAAGASLFDTRAALDENYQDLQALIDQLKRGITLVNGEWQMLTPPSTLISAFEAALKYITAAMKLYELMLQVQEQEKFRRAVLDAIANADEPTRQRVIENLRQLRAAGLALSGH